MERDGVRSREREVEAREWREEREGIGREAREGREREGREGEGRKPCECESLASFYYKSNDPYNMTIYHFKELKQKLLCQGLRRTKKRRL